MSESHVLTAGLLRVEFRYCRDRFGHRIFLGEAPTTATCGSGPAEAAVPLLQTLEGTSQQAWPASPPLQEVQIERIAGLHSSCLPKDLVKQNAVGQSSKEQHALEKREAGSEVALCVGKAGSSHWSLSCLADPIENRLLFEFACRLKTVPAQLGVSYATGPRAGGWNSARGLRLRTAGGELSLTCLENTRSELDPTGEQEGLILIRPDRFETSYPQTVLWSYCLQYTAGE